MPTLLFLSMRGKEVENSLIMSRRETIRQQLIIKRIYVKNFFQMSYRALHVFVCVRGCVYVGICLQKRTQWLLIISVLPDVWHVLVRNGMLYLSRACRTSGGYILFQIYVKRRPWIRLSNSHNKRTFKMYLYLMMCVLKKTRFQYFCQCILSVNYYKYHLVTTGKL